MFLTNASHPFLNLLSFGAIHPATETTPSPISSAADKTPSPSFAPVMARVLNTFVPIDDSE